MPAQEYVEAVRAEILAYDAETYIDEEILAKVASYFEESGYGREDLISEDGQPSKVYFAYDVLLFSSDSSDN